MGEDRVTRSEDQAAAWGRDNAEPLDWPALAELDDATGTPLPVPDWIVGILRANADRIETWWGH